MKRTIKLVAGIALMASTIAGCTKILDQEPLTDLTEKNALGSAANAEASLSSAYSALLPGLYYGEVMNTITELPGDNTMTANGARTMWDDFTWNPTTDFVQNYSQIYNAIAKANLIITLVPDVNMDETRRKQIIGEGHFLRALHYFNLVRLYGGVSLYTEPILSGDAATINEKGLRPRASVEEVYDLIIDDLSKAEEMVGGSQPNAAQNRNRAVKATVYALQAKVFLTKRDYASAKAACQKVFDNGALYSMVTDFNALWPVRIKRSLFLKYITIRPHWVVASCPI
ncbi:MAG: RagB/SusD family nutrient uptake outer membrane protein [Chitinophagaceae bacterium]